MQWILESIMKRILLIFIAFILYATPQGLAQKKNVEMANKLLGAGKLSEARNYLRDAMTTHPTDSDARTWYLAGLIEFKSYDNDIRKRQINPKDATVKNSEMADKALNGYKYFLTAQHLDSLPNRKGKIKPRYTKEILEELDKHAYDIYRAGAIKYNEKKYYPDAYTGFMASARIASNPLMEKAPKLMSDSLRADSYYYAGISAWAAGIPDTALNAFNLAIQSGLDNPDVYVFKMAIRESMLKSNPESYALKDSLFNICKEAYKKYGISNHAFISRMIDILNHYGRSEEALKILNSQIIATPNECFLYGLRAWTNEQLGLDDDAVYDYRKAAEMRDVEALTLLRGAHKLYRMGAKMKEQLSGTKKQQTAKRRAIIDDFLNPAHEMALRARALSTDTDEITLIDNLLENIDYASTIIK